VIVRGGNERPRDAKRSLPSYRTCPTPPGHSHLPVSSLRVSLGRHSDQALAVMGMRSGTCRCAPRRLSKQSRCVSRSRKFGDHPTQTLPPLLGEGVRGVACLFLFPSPLAGSVKSIRLRVVSSHENGDLKLYPVFLAPLRALAAALCICVRAEIRPQLSRQRSSAIRLMPRAYSVRSRG